MNPFDLFFALLIMLGFIVIPGIPLSYLLFGKKRLFVFSSIIGVMQIYVIYFLIKNGLAVLDFPLIAFVFGLFFFVPSAFIIKSEEIKFNLIFEYISGMAGNFDVIDGDEEDE